MWTGLGLETSSTKLVPSNALVINNVGIPSFRESGIKESPGNI